MLSRTWHGWPTLLAIGITCIILGFCGRALAFWDNDGIFLVPAGRLLVIPGIIVSLLALVRGGVSIFPAMPAWPFCAGLIVVFLTNWLCRPYVLLEGPIIRGQIILGAIVTVLGRKYLTDRLLLGVAVVVALVHLKGFHDAADGRLLFSDDHAVFLYRLLLLGSEFPRIPFWTPLWNGGLDARDFFATGALNVFFFAWPFVYFTDLTQSYNIFVSLLVTLLPAGSLFASARISGLTLGASSLAALLSLSTSLLWYRWALAYGTMGFFISTSLSPIALALAVRFLDAKSPFPFRYAVSFVVVCTLLICWAPGLAFLAFPGLLAMITLRRWMFDRSRVITVLVLSVIAVSLLGTLWSVSKVGKFLGVQTEATQMPGTQSSPMEEKSKYRHSGSNSNLSASVRVAQETVNAVNPLILLLTVPGLLALPGPLRLVLGGTFAVLGVLGSLIVPLFPQLELDRMLVVVAFLATLPVAALLYDLIYQKPSGMVVSGILGGFLFASSVSSAGVMYNRSLERMSFADAVVKDLVSVLESTVGDGRAVFTGCVVHELSGGHLAPLALWSGKSLVASSHAHTLWNYAQVIPESYFSRGDVGIVEFFDHMNATVVVAHEPYWRDYFIARPDMYREIWRRDGFIVFERSGFRTDYFLRGAGAFVGQSISSITVRPDSTDVVLKFRYFDFLTSSSCTISSYPAAPEYPMLRLTGCEPGQDVTIRSVGPITRILGGPK